MFNTGVIPQARVRNILRLIEDDPDSPKKHFVYESHRSRHHVGPGVTYPSELGPLTVLCLIGPEVCYFQGGMVYFVDQRDFMGLVNSQSVYGARTDIGTSSTRPVTVAEVEFVLGVVAAVGPLACWTVIGNDVVAFIKSKRQKIAKWSAQVASLFLTRMILKRYALNLYQKVSGLHVDGAWSSLTEAVATDDTAIFRFTGRLLGVYKSDELVERAIDQRWSVFSCIFRGLEAVLESSPRVAGDAENGQEATVKHFVSSLGKLGIRMSSSEVQSLLQAVHKHPHQIKKSIELLRTEFESEAA